MRQYIIENIILFTIIVVPILIVAVIANRRNTITSWKRAYTMEHKVRKVHNKA